ncbi:MAG TPA: ABC transporter ATP-binding protein [Bryobacteraceae bacterium]|jgi:subfamily B ATP-binding cassette protein MsbA|nr:ABC transporter ATP-binding protein [Bryobacteraceae bacterium]
MPAEEKKPKRKQSEQIRELWPDLREMILPRRKILAVGFVLMIINRLSGLVLPGSTKYLIDDVVGKKHWDLLLPLVGAVLGATLIQGVTSFTLTQLLSKAAQRLIAELRQKVQAHIGRLQVSYYDANKSGVLVSRIMTDVEGVRNLIGTGLVEFVGGLMTAGIALFFLLRISSLMTGLAAAFVILFSFALNQAFTKIRPIFRERGKITGDVTGRLTESLGGVRVVKGYHAEAREAAVFGEGVKRLLDNVLRSLTAISLMSLSATVLMGLVGGLVMYVGANQIRQGSISLGDFVTFTAFLAFLIAPVFQIVGIGTQLTEAFAGLDRTREVLRERPEDQDPRRTVALGPIGGEVEFEHVGFSYEAGKQVLYDVSFKSNPGTVTALVGPSGSGKSTIISLIAAFHVPSEGVVRVDGVDLSTVRLADFRTQLGVVLQDTFLFDGTIEENIAFARPGATKEQILEACRIARVDEFAEGFEKKYETIVGERGVKLSGGQRQRVSIARAILADPRILILDEATSSLDSESEALIQEGLKFLMKGRTTFVIAHRLSTIRRAEQILVVEGGRIVERGTHESLYALNGRYWDLYTRQHGVESNLFLAPGEGDTISEADRAKAEAKEASGITEAMRLMRGR